MPIYEYVCRACGHRFEKLVQGAAPPPCPVCHGTELDQQFSVFSVGAGSSSPSRPAPAAPCGACGDPRGPGSCNLN